MRAQASVEPSWNRRINRALLVSGDFVSILVVLDHFSMTVEIYIYKD